MSYYVTNDNSFLDIKNAHLRVTGNVHTDVLKVGSIGFQPAGSNISGTVNFTNVTTGVTTSSNLDVGGTLNLGTIELSASTHTLDHITARGNVTSTTVQFDNATTGLVTTANVEVGGELTVTGNVETKNINMLHTSNTASIKLNSNVVTEFPRSKKLIRYPRVALGTNASAYSGVGSGSTVSGYTIKASSEYNGSFLASKAFTNTNDTNDLDAWLTSSTAYSSNTPVANSATLAKFGQQGSWLEIKLPDAIQLHSTHIFSRRTHVTERNDTADIWASNTGNDDDWVKLTTINFNNTYTDIIPMVADIDTPTYYQYFAIQITRVNWSGAYANIGEWELYGVPEYDPEAHGVDVTIKSIPNVPNTDWLEVYYDGQDYTADTEFDQANEVLDKAGADNHGSQSGGVGFDTEYKAFTFDGSNDYISTSVNATLTYHTASMWIQFDSPGNGWECVFSIAPSTPSGFDNFNLYFNTNYFRLESGVASNFPYYDFDYDFEIGKWVHLTCIFRGSGLQDCEVYINNKRLSHSSGSQNPTGDITLSGTNILRVGAAYSTSYVFDGSIANFRLFNRVLTPDEIYKLYAYQKEYFGYGDLGMTLKAGRLGIGTSEPRAALDVRGDIHGGCPVYFQALYNANLQAARYDVAPYGTLVPWDTLFEHKGDCFDTSSGLFTAPIDGLYSFGYSMRKQTGSYGDFWTYVQKNGSPLNGSGNAPGRVYVDGGSSGASVFASQRFILDLSTGDTVGVIIATTSSIDARISNSYNYFHGYYIGTGNGSFGSYSY